MAVRVKPETGEVDVKHRCRVTNEPEYDRTRGNLTIWFEETSIRESWTPPRPIGRGKPEWYSETAIQTCLKIKTSFQLPYRVTEGLIKSLISLSDLGLPVPDHTSLSRRTGALSVQILRRPRQGATHVVVDSTGLKIFGEGEWKVRQHGVGKRRTWRKSHLAVDETAKDITGIEVTTTAGGDSQIVPGLFDEFDGEVSQVSADGAYDSRGCHTATTERG
ncbi:MAG TPA: IS5 family transposase, partial [Accumulibacter sp.]|nr:IS5 family transposase [Accumulibacter sp.]